MLSSPPWTGLPFCKRTTLLKYHHEMSRTFWSGLSFWNIPTLLKLVHEMLRTLALETFQLYLMAYVRVQGLPSLDLVTLGVSQEDFECGQMSSQ
jgi:hypothetical protein